MAETAKKGKEDKKTSWFSGLKAEYNKIVWSDKQTIAKETTAVVAITAVLGILISLIDSVVLQLVNFLIK